MSNPLDGQGYPVWDREHPTAAAHALIAQTALNSSAICKRASYHRPFHYWSCWVGHGAVQGDQELRIRGKPDLALPAQGKRL